MRRERIKSFELSKIKKSFEADHELFFDLDFTIPLGKITVIEGAPGTGKSQLLRLMAGLNEPTAGEIFFNSKPLSQMTFEEFVPIRQSTSICFEHGGLLMNKTVLENLKLPLDYHKQWRNERSQKFLEELTKDFGINPYLNLRPSSVSAGVRKISGLIRALLSNPQVIFLDEPSLGIGEDAVLMLKTSIEKYRKQGMGDETFLIASSDKKFISELDCERYKITDRKLLKVG